MKKVIITTLAVTSLLVLSACSTDTEAVSQEVVTNTVVETANDTFLMPVGTTYSEENPRNNKAFDITIDFVNEYVGEFGDSEFAPRIDMKAVEVDFTITNTGEEVLELPNDIFISLIDKYTSKEYSRVLSSAIDATHPQMAFETIEAGQTKTFTKVIELPLELSIYDCMVYLGATVGLITWDVENSIVPEHVSED